MGKHDTSLYEEEMITILRDNWVSVPPGSWGHSKDGISVNALDSMVRIIAHAALRVMVCLPGGRNEDYLNLSILYANAVLTDGCLISCLPPSGRPVLRRIISMRTRYHQRKFLKILVPMVEEEMRQYDDNKGRHDGPVA